MYQRHEKESCHDKCKYIYIYILHTIINFAMMIKSALTSSNKIYNQSRVCN